MRKLIVPVLIGIVGVVILVWLGVWQLQRLEWKQGILAQIDARLAQDPILLPAAPTEEADEYRNVIVRGRPLGEELHVLDSGSSGGTGYRVISAFETEEGRRILLDQGILPVEAKDAPPATEEVEVLGALLWPDDLTGSTPPPDLDRNIWFARDLPAMADHLETEPLLVVLGMASRYDERLTPVPIDIGTIRNNHLEYAITWLLLAVIWFSMAIYWVMRLMRRKEGRL